MTLEDYATAELLALGDPTRGEPAFPQLRNHLFAELTGFGFRSIALAAERGADMPADRDLLFWMRNYHAGRLTLHEFDGTARSLLDIRAAEAPRGGTLVFAPNRLLRDLQPIFSGQLGDRFRFIAGSLGASPALGIGNPEDDSFEGLLRLSEAYALVPAARMPRGTVRSAHPAYDPLDEPTLAAADAVLHVATGIDPGVLTERILAMPGVEHQEAAGDLFFFVGAERMRPFATIVHNDVPGFDEASQLLRPGVFRLNVDLGRREFERRFGFPPKELPAYLADYDFARTDEVFPHPSYGTAAWGSIVCPGPWRMPEVDELLAHARQRPR